MEERTIARLEAAPVPPLTHAGARRVVGIVGGGQLARMTVEAAGPLSIDVRVLAGAPGDAAALGGAVTEVGDPSDVSALERFSARCDVLTFDHELVDPDIVRALEGRGQVVFPGSSVLRFADKAHQRAGLAALGLAVPDHEVVTEAAALEGFGERHGWPVVAKLAFGGYDGRGVFVLDGPEAARELIDNVSVPVVAEPHLAIERELAAIVARGASGEQLVYPIVETRQHDGICRETLVPSGAGAERERQAAALALEIAEAIGAVGILAVELFVVGGVLLVNELAPRPHNSAHWTIEGAATSQFENHLRAVLGWPLGDASLAAPAVATVNVLGNAGGDDPRDLLPGALRVPGARVHLYGKAPRPGRKLGHVTVAGADPGDVLGRAREAAALLGSPPWEPPAHREGR